QHNAIDAMSDTIFASPATIPGCGPIPAAQLPPMAVPSALGVSEVACAQALQPSIIFVSIGNNDALQSLTLGIPPTDIGTFAKQFAGLIGALSKTGAKLVVSNVPDVSVVPYLIPVPAFKTSCPVATPPLPSTVTNADYVVLDITNPAAT